MQCHRILCSLHSLLGSLLLPSAALLHMSPALSRQTHLLKSSYCRQPLGQTLHEVWYLPQVTNPVQWETTLKTLLDKGLQQSYEIGPNKVIAGIMKRVDKKSPITNITA